MSLPHDFKEIEPYNTRKKTHPSRRKVGVFIVGSVLFLIMAIIAGLFVFQNVLRPSQQQRVINILPFMGTFLNQPDVDARIPTAAPNPNSGISAEDLLQMPFSTLTSPAQAPSPTPPDGNGG